MPPVSIRHPRQSRHPRLKLTVSTVFRATFTPRPSSAEEGLGVKVARNTVETVNFSRGCRDWRGCRIDTGGIRAGRTRAASVTTVAIGPHEPWHRAAAVTQAP